MMLKFKPKTQWIWTVAFFLSFLGILFFYTGCSMMTKRSISGEFTLQKFETEVLENGLTIIWLEDHKLPQISLQLLISSGSVYEAEVEAGYHALTASMLGQSTLKYTAFELNEKLEQFGLDFSVQSQEDFTVLSLSGLNMHEEKMINLFVHILLESQFDSKDFLRQKQNVLASLKRFVDTPENVANLASYRLIYGSHPYGRLNSGTIKSVTTMSVEDSIRIYKVFYVPNRSIMAISGAYSPQFKKLVRSELARWQSLEKVLKKPISLDASWPKSLQIQVYTKPGLEQTEIRWGHRMIPRNHPDFLKVRVANMALGGAFASRFNQIIRDDLGLTYAIYSSIDAKREGGNFLISTFTRHEKVDEVINQVKKIFQNYVEEGITLRELQAAQAVMIGQFPTTVETMERLGYSLISLWAYGVSEDYLINYQKYVANLQLDEINEVIKKYFHPHELSMVIYTDFEKVKSKLKSLGINSAQTFKME